MKKWVEPTLGLLSGGFLARYKFASRFAYNKHVLDLGCGPGYGCKILKTLGQASRVVGVDSDKRAIDFSRKQYSDTRGVEFIQGNVYNLPLANSSAHLIVSFGVIEYLDDPSAFLREIKRVLTKDGILILSTTNKLAPYKKKGEYKSIYNKEYCSKELRKILVGYFKNVKLSKQDVTIFAFNDKINTLFPKNSRTKLPSFIRNIFLVNWLEFILLEKKFPLLATPKKNRRIYSQFAAISRFRLKMTQKV